MSYVHFTEEQKQRGSGEAGSRRPHLTWLIQRRIVFSIFRKRNRQERTNCSRTAHIVIDTGLFCTLYKLRDIFRKQDILAVDNIYCVCCNAATV